MKVLQGKVCLVTGSGRGIGKAIACRFAGEGAALITNALTPSNAQATAQEIVEKGGRIISSRARCVSISPFCPGSDGVQQAATRRYILTAAARMMIRAGSPGKLLALPGGVFPDDGRSIRLSGEDGWVEVARIETGRIRTRG